VSMPTVDQVTRFIAQYVTIRSAGALPSFCWEKATARRVRPAWSTRVQDRWSMASTASSWCLVATDLEALFGATPGNDRPYPLYPALVLRRGRLVPTTRSPGGAI